MRRVWDGLAAIFVTAFAIYLLYQLVKPYALFIVLALILFFLGSKMYYRARRG